MLSKLRNKIIVIILLTGLSGFTYYIQYLIFHNERDTIFYLLQDLAFVPIQVITVTLILNQIINIMETRKKIKKINVIISTFFIEVGTPILKILSKFNPNQEELRKIITFDELDKIKEYSLKKQVSEFEFDIYAEPEKLQELADILIKSKDYMLNMLANPNLLEHDSFTDMLWAVFHVADELQSRQDLPSLTKEDLSHLSNDLLRAYSAIVLEWIQYMRYLHDEYPYLYVTEVRKVPSWLQGGQK